MLVELEGRHRGDATVLRDVGGLVDVDLDQHRLAVVFGAQLVVDGRDLGVRYQDLADLILGDLVELLVGQIRLGWGCVEFPLKSRLG